MGAPTSMRFYRYSIESLDVLFPNGEGIAKIDNKHVNSIMIDRDYDSNFFPVLRMSVTMDSDLYYRIVENKTSVRFRLRAQKFVKNEENRVTIKKDLFNDIFCFFLDDNTPFLRKDDKKATKEATGEDKSMQTIAGNEFVFYLFKEKDLLNTKIHLNTVIAETDMATALTYCLTQGNFSKVLMAPIENTGTYTEVLLPAMTLLATINYLDSQYGFYSRGSLIFFDLDTIYIIDRNPKCTAWRQGEYLQTVFNIKSSVNPDNLSPGSYDNEQERRHYINVPLDAITMFNTSVTNDQIEGNHVYIVNALSGKTTDIKSNAPQRGDGTYKVLFNKYNNEYASKAEAYRRNENGSIIQINLGEIDIEALTPNKEFLFTFEDTVFNRNHGGPYRIIKSTMVLAKQGEEFSMSVMATFKKVNG